MIRFDRAAIAAALTLAFAPLTAHAADRQMLSAHVQVDDLNLESAAGQRTFATRLRIAAAAACGGSSLELRDRIDAQRCRAEMMKDGRTRLASRGAPRAVVLAAIARR